MESRPSLQALDAKPIVRPLPKPLWIAASQIMHVAVLYLKRSAIGPSPS